MKWLENQLARTDLSIKEIKDYRDALNVMRYAVSEAHKKGFVIGLREAVQERRLNGEAISPKLEKLIIAQKLIKSNLCYTMKEISKISELSIDVVKLLWSCREQTAIV